MSLHFVRTKQSENPLFWGTHGDHSDPARHGHFQQKDVVAYIIDKCSSDDPDWVLAPNDLDMQPDGHKTYLSDRVSAALQNLVKAGVLKRNCIGGRTLWAAPCLDPA